MKATIYTTTWELDTPKCIQDSPLNSSIFTCWIQWRTMQTWLFSFPWNQVKSLWTPCTTTLKTASKVGLSWRIILRVKLLFGSLNSRWEETKTTQQCKMTHKSETIRLASRRSCKTTYNRAALSYMLLQSPKATCRLRWILQRILSSKKENFLSL